MAPPAPVPEPLAERGWIATAEGPQGPVRPEVVEALPLPGAGRMQPLVLAALAVLGLVGVVGALETANFVAAQFAQATWLGWLTLALVGPLAGLLGWSLLREWRGYSQIETVEGLRRRLAADELPVVRAAAIEWLAAIDAEPGMRRVVEGAADAATIRALLRSGPLAEVTQTTTLVGRSAAVQVMAATAVIPWPGLDGIIVAWRGMRLVRQVAALHGFRPGTLGTLRLFQRVALDAGSVAAADIAAAAVTEAVFNSHALGGLAGQATGAAVAARRMLRLSHAVAQVCRPL
jgi:putative membrane protein